MFSQDTDVSPADTLCGDGTGAPIPNDVQPRYEQQQYFNAAPYYDGRITHTNAVGNPNGGTENAEATKGERIYICALFRIEQIHKNESSHNREADGCVGKHNQFHTTSTNLEEEPLRLLDSNKKTAKKRCKGIPKGTLVFVSVHSTGFASDDTIADQTSLPRLPTGESIWAPLAPHSLLFRKQMLQFFPK
jgi:hypothetical protein